MSETGSPGARYRIGAYRFWHHHIRLMLAERDDPEADAHNLLAVLSAEHIRAVTIELGHLRARRAALALVDALAH